MSLPRFNFIMTFFGEPLKGKRWQSSSKVSSKIPETFDSKISRYSLLDYCSFFFFFLFFSIWVFFQEHLRITGLQKKGEGISLTAYYHFHPLHRHLDISRTITAESSPLHIACSRTRTGNLWFLSASR